MIAIRRKPLATFANPRQYCYLELFSQKKCEKKTLNFYLKNKFYLLHFEELQFCERFIISEKNF